MTDELETRRRRAAYRCAHRGTKEMDIMLGRYGEAMLPTLADPQLAHFEMVGGLEQQTGEKDVEQQLLGERHQRDDVQRPQCDTNREQDSGVRHAKALGDDRDGGRHAVDQDDSRHHAL